MKRHIAVISCLSLGLLMSGLVVLHRGRIQELSIRMSSSDQQERMAHTLAGSDALDCGRVPDARSDQQRKPVDACVVTAYQKKQPFRVRYDLEGNSFWIVGTDKGQIYSLYRSGSMETIPLLRQSPTIVQINGQLRLVPAPLQYREYPVFSFGLKQFMS